MDEVDFERAERLARAEIESGINAARNETRPPADWDRTTCTQCGEDIDAGRAILGRHTCLLCQQELELKQRLTARR
jgi:RNA polymerase-binding transcription factor DksA